MTPAINASEAGTISIGGLTVNRFGFGSMRLTGDGIWGPPIDKNAAMDVLRKAVALGINFIDTADSYGPYVTEELIAETLYPYPEDLVIATKGGLERTGPNKWPVNGHPDHLKVALEGSLKRLKRDHIDLYQLHRFDPKVPVEESLGFLKKMQDEGKIRHIGLSEVSVEDIKKASGLVKVVSVQNQYNLGFRKWESVLEWCEANDVAFLPWFPLSAGKMKEQAILDKIAVTHSASNYQLVLAWLLNHSEQILPIAGTSSAGHLEENMESVRMTLNDNELQEIELLQSI